MACNVCLQEIMKKMSDCFEAKLQKHFAWFLVGWRWWLFFRSFPPLPCFIFPLLFCPYARADPEKWGLSARVVNPAPSQATLIILTVSLRITQAGRCEEKYWWEGVNRGKTCSNKAALAQIVMIFSCLVHFFLNTQIPELCILWTARHLIIFHWMEKTIIPVN